MRIDIPLGSERFVIDPTQLTRASDRGAWRLNAPYQDYQIEILVAGDTSAPGATELDLAERVVAHLDDFVAVSRFYLRTFVDERKLDAPGEWDPAWLEFGLDPEKLPESFELILGHDGDNYGAWGVRFFRGPFGFRPYEFRQFQM